MDHEQELVEKEPFLGSNSTRRLKIRDSLWKSTYSWPRIVVLGQWFIIVMLAVFSAAVWNSSRSNPYALPQNHAYSPAEHFITYKSYNFMASLGPQRTEYQGRPSPEIDETWRNLYKYAISRIPRSEAQKLSNKTVPIPGDPGQYVIGLEVFHQLHCLNALRLKLWSEQYLQNDEEEEVMHIEHCIDTLRQSLMCTADVTPILWKWDNAMNLSRSIATIYHTCRDFQAIYQWGKEHHLKSFDRRIYVEDDL